MRVLVALCLSFVIHLKTTTMPAATKSLPAVPSGLRKGTATDHQATATPTNAAPPKQTPRSCRVLRSTDHSVKSLSMHAIRSYTVPGRSLMSSTVAAAPNLLLRRFSSFLRFCVPPSNPESKPRLAVTMVVSKVQTEPNSRTFPLKVRFRGGPKFGPKTRPKNICADTLIRYDSKSR